MNTPRSLDHDGLDGVLPTSKAPSPLHKYLIWAGVFLILLAILLIVFWLNKENTVSKPDLIAENKPLIKSKENLSGLETSQTASISTTSDNISASTKTEKTIKAISNPILPDTSKVIALKNINDEVLTRKEQQLNQKETISSALKDKKTLVKTITKQTKSTTHEEQQASLATAAIKTNDSIKKSSDISLSSSIHTRSSPVPTGQPSNQAPVIKVDNNSSTNILTASNTSQTYLFKLSSNKIESLSEDTTKRLTTFVNRCNNKVVIVGHTCNLGISEFNDHLGLARAKSMSQFLVEQGIDQEILIIRSEGMNHPVANNATWSGRRLNRRVELLCLKN